jgi:acid phosphatase
MDVGYTKKRWEQWERDNAEEVGLVPGAGPFIAELEKLKVVIVYVSNRLENLKDSTIRALAHNGINTQGLQEGLQSRLLLSNGVSSKQSRIKQAEENFHVLAYLGDNLNDFPGEAEQAQDIAQRLATRRQKVEGAEQLWGTRWFMIPNPVYGNWDQILPKTTRERLDLLNRASNLKFVDAK